MNVGSAGAALRSFVKARRVVLAGAQVWRPPSLPRPPRVLRARRVVLAGAQVASTRVLGPPPPLGSALVRSDVLCVARAGRGDHSRRARLACVRGGIDKNPFYHYSTWAAHVSGDL